MLSQLAAYTVRRPKVVLAAVLMLFSISVVLGGSVSDKLGTGGNTDPAAESSQADEFLDQHFGTTANLVIQLLARDGTVDSAEVAAVRDRVRQLISAESKAQLTRSFGDQGAGDLRSKDGRSGLMLVHVGGTTDEAAETAKRIIASLPVDPNVTVRAGGSLGVQQEIRDKVKHDLEISESIAVPISLAVLVIVFGGLIAAALPVVVGIVSIVSTLTVLLLMTTITDVSVHALTVATAFGLGLSIDFGLLMVSRFREECANGKDHHQAIVATVTTAGRTILFSAATVTLAMTSLLVFPTYFLRSVGIAASATVLLSAFSAIVVLPALLTLLGKRVDSLAIIRRKTPLSADSLFWRRFAEVVTRRPMLYALPVVAVLLGLGIPFLSAQYATPDERALPKESNARLVAESLQREFQLDPSQAITLVSRADAGALKDLAADISRMDGVVQVNGPTGKYEHGQVVGPPPAKASGPSYAIVYLSVRADSDLAQHLVHDIRAKITDHRVEVGGPTATLIDSRAAITDQLPLAITLIAVATFILLFLFTGSVVVPIKALLLNLLVLSAVLGVMVWIFQEGHGASLLGIDPTPLNPSMVVLLCAIAFSLSVDYEIFLLSRIKEARDSGLSNDASTVIGLGRVGRIVTSAALLLTITLLSFANGLSFMKMFGIGTALAVVIDATIIRGVVVPAFLRLAGDLNWWAPRPLRWLHSRIGISEAPSDADAEAEVVSAVAPAPDVVPVPPAKQAAEEPAAPIAAVPPSEIEVIPGRHLVANVNGAVIVVAHRDRAPLSPRSVAAQQLAALADMVRRTDPKRLVEAFSRLSRETTWTRTLVDAGIIMPTPAGLEVLLCGSVTVALDNGTGQTLLHGHGRLVHRSVPVPAVAAVITVDELGQRPRPSTDGHGVYRLSGGTVAGQGAVIWSTPAAINGRVCAAPMESRPKRWVFLDDNSRFDINRDCVIGRAPHGTDAVRRGLRPVRIEDHAGEMSRAHIEVRVGDREVVVIDRNSTNGVFMREPAQRGWTRLTPWEPVTWRPGGYVQIGGRILRLHVSADRLAQRGSRINVPHDISREPHAGTAQPAALAK